MTETEITGDRKDRTVTFGVQGSHSWRRLVCM